MPNLIGTAPDQVPTNGLLGNMAFQNKEGVVTDLLSTTALTVTGTASFSNNGNQNLFLLDTALSSRSSLQISGPVTYFNGNIDSASQGQFIWRTSNAYTERMRIDASGNVAIGATNPGGWRLRLEKNDAQHLFLFNNTGSGTRISMADQAWQAEIEQNAGSLLFKTGGTTERMRISTTGDFGIGTSAPAYKLHVVGNSAIESDNTSGAQLTIRGATNTNNRLYLGYDTDDNVGRISAITEGTSFRNLILQGGGGNVGIGTSAPATLLHISATNPEFRLQGINGTGSTHKIRSTGLNSEALQITSAGDAYYNANIHVFRAANESTEYMRITNTGNVGIGTTSPAAKLDIAAAGTLYARIQNTSSTGDAYLSTQNSLGSGLFGINATGPYVYTAQALPMLFYTTGLERMRLNANGWLGIGRTAQGVFDVHNGANGTVSYFYGGGSVVYSDIDTHVFRRAAGAESMRINASGNLLVGTTVFPTGTGNSGVSIENLNGTGGRIFLGKTFSGNLDSLANYHNGVYVGGVVYSNTATSFPTSSDVRLKDNIKDADDAASLIDAIQVRKFDWKADGSHQRYGFVAQELVTVAPEAVSQPEDPEDMMGVDYSKLVPMLVKEIQSLRARVAQLEGN